MFTLRHMLIKSFVLLVAGLSSSVFAFDCYDVDRDNALVQYSADSAQVPNGTCQDSGHAYVLFALDIYDATVGPLWVDYQNAIATDPLLSDYTPAELLNAGAAALTGTEPVQEMTPVEMATALGAGFITALPCVMAVWGGRRVLEALGLSS